MTHDAFKLVNGFDQKSDLSLLLPAGQRALGVGNNGHAIERTHDSVGDLRDEIDTLRRAVLALTRKRAPRTPKALTVQDGESLCASDRQGDRSADRAHRGVGETWSGWRFMERNLAAKHATRRRRFDH
jgi:hypothetical protein